MDKIQFFLVKESNLIICLFVSEFVGGEDHTDFSTEFAWNFPLVWSGKTWNSEFKVKINVVFFPLHVDVMLILRFRMPTSCKSNKSYETERWSECKRFCIVHSLNKTKNVILYIAKRFCKKDGVENTTKAAVIVCECKKIKTNHHNFPRWDDITSSITLLKKERLETGCSLYKLVEFRGSFSVGVAQLGC